MICLLIVQYFLDMLCFGPSTLVLILFAISRFTILVGILCIVLILVHNVMLVNTQDLDVPPRFGCSPDSVSLYELVNEFSIIESFFCGCRDGSKVPITIGDVSKYLGIAS